MQKVAPDSKKVIIIGGGIGGLSAAHELAERGFKVEVYEMKSIPGGKARSMHFKNTGKDGRKDLPSEHGLRFFPGFYKHVYDTMRRIPYRDNLNGVYDNLVKVPYMLAATTDKPLISLPLTWPEYAPQVAHLIAQDSPDTFEIPADEMEYFLNQVWKFWSSSRIRRIHEYENISWWDYIGAGTRSKKYQDYLAKGHTTQLVACKANLASARTIGDAGFKLITQLLNPQSSPDKILNGPTNDVWINPWLDYLRSLGVSYNLEHKLKKIQVAGKKITSITVTDLNQGVDRTLTADYYIVALPIEVFIKYLTPEMLLASPELSNLPQLSKSTEWMNGIMYYLNQKLDIDRSHISLLDSPWALTGIAQTKSWREFEPDAVGDGTVVEILSIAVSNWETPGVLFNKPAKNCTPEEISQEIWEQIKQGLNHEREIIKDEYLHSWFLDPDIVNIEGNPHNKVNLEPVLVNEVGTWKLRPNAYTGISNMFIAADYVKTYTDLATMEAANEAARRATNHIIQAAGVDAPLAKLFDQDRPFYFKPLLWYDAWRFKRGLPWDSAPWLIHISYKLLVALNRLTRKYISPAVR